MKDLLLSKFEQHKVDMSQIKGGNDVITGWRQNGSNSFIDYRTDEGQTVCDQYVGNDPENWFESFAGEIDYD